MDKRVIPLKLAEEGLSPRVSLSSASNGTKSSLIHLIHPILFSIYKFWLFLSSLTRWITLSLAYITFNLSHVVITPLFPPNPSSLESQSEISFLLFSLNHAPLIFPLLFSFLESRDEIPFKGGRFVTTQISQFGLWWIFTKFLNFF